MEMNSRTLLIAYSLQFKGEWTTIMQHLSAAEKPDDIYLEQATSLELASRVKTILDPDYPEYLKKIPQPPFVLYYYGDFSLISDPNKNIAIRGTRNNSDYGEAKTKEIAGELANKEYNIVAGLALGTDTVALNSAIENGGKVIAVLGNGIDYCYPASNAKLYAKIKKDHLLLSEYPGSETPEPAHFPFRNRIIAGISKALVFTELKPKGHFTTDVAYGLTLGKEIMCVPERADKDSACNELIKQGAVLVEDCSDIIEQIEA